VGRMSFDWTSALFYDIIILGILLFTIGFILAEKITREFKKPNHTILFILIAFTFILNEILFHYVRDFGMLAIWITSVLFLLGVSMRIWIVNIIMIVRKIKEKKKEGLKA
jgi:hypothetical protein